MATMNQVGSGLKGTTGSGNFVGGTSPTINGSQVTLPLIDKVNVQVITSTGTYTPTSGMQYCTVEIVGGGGGGGGAASANSSQCGAGSGGGGGGYCRKTYTAAQIGASATVNIGTGGAGGVGAGAIGGGNASSFVPSGAGVTLTANGGAAGSSNSNVSTAGALGVTTGGAGGNATNGDINIVGQNGQGMFMAVNAQGFISGPGGSSALGLGALGTFCTGGSNGYSASGYGGGGGGAGVTNASGSLTGGSGSNGVCYITEYISA